MKPPEEIPADMLDAFTCGGKIRVEHKYLDNACSEIQEEFRANFTPETLQRYRMMARRKQWNYYGQTDQWLYEALARFPVRGETVALWGSANPWYEAVLLDAGAHEVIVIEYGDRPSIGENIVYFKPDYAKGIRFTSQVSISSFEHDGLGRYGDPLNPDGDLDAMKAAAEALSQGGKLILSVPLGMDKLVWNAHRIYGRIRLPMLLEGWKTVATFGYVEEMMDRDTGIDAAYQPVFVLER